SSTTHLESLINSIRKILPDIHIIGITSSENNVNSGILSKILFKPITNLKMYNEIISLIGPNYISKHTPEIQLKNTKLLIIENISHNQEIIISFLKKLGYHDIFLAYTEHEAMTAVKKNNYDVIFLNLTISNLDYINLVKKINKVNKKSLIIGISNNDSAELQRACFKIGINAFLLRPLQFNDMDLLMKAVEDKLRGS
ncbi:MAG: response regulator, partial [Romboutsia sp.]|nr:response regulator [Romboutsia sp.]